MNECLLSDAAQQPRGRFELKELKTQSENFSPQKHRQTAEGKLAQRRLFGGSVRVIVCDVMSTLDISHTDHTQRMTGRETS